MRVSSFFGSLLVSLVLTSAWASPLDDFASERSVISGPAVKMARDAVKSYLTTGKRIKAPGKLPKAFSRKAAVFVTMAKRGQRRGCKGTFEPAMSNLAEEIISSAIGAATGDIRYRPVRSNELADLTFTVSIVGPLKRVRESDSYSPGRYGLLVRSGSRSGVILPGEAKTSSWRLAEARRQAGVRPGESAELFVFETVALREPAKVPAARRRQVR